MKVGLFGGTYNPIHNAHLIIAEWICSRLELDYIYFIPTAHPPHRQHDTEIIEIHHRTAMVRHAIKDNPCFRLAGFESEVDAAVYSVDTVRAFIKQYPELSGSLHFIIGEDNFRMLHTWKEAVELSRLSRIVVARRSVDLPERIPGGLEPPVFVDTPRIDISASIVRDRIRTGKSVRYIIPESVETYIRENNLYT